MQAPWTEIEKLRQDIISIKSALSGKAEKHEIHSANNAVDRLECSIGEIKASMDRMKYRLQILEESETRRQQVG